MGRNAFLGNVVHFLGADLHLERLAAIADHRRVQRLIKVIARYRDPIFETFGHRRPNIVYDAHRQVTIFAVVLSDDAGGDQIVHLFDHDLLLLELLPKRIETLYAALYLNERNFVLGKLFRDSCFYLLDCSFEFRATGVDFASKAFVLVGVEILKGKIFEFASHLTHSEPMGDRCVDIESFLRNAFAFLRLEKLHCPHIVQSVDQFDEHDSDIRRHG